MPATKGDNLFLAVSHQLPPLSPAAAWSRRTSVYSGNSRAWAGHSATQMPHPWQERVRTRALPWTTIAPWGQVRTQVRQAAQAPSGGRKARVTGAASGSSPFRKETTAAAAREAAVPASPAGTGSLPAATRKIPRRLVVTAR
ncbi:hypothetical protein MTY_1464 [Moorella thermoacetica Y72]|uniref:Uncharacterized protein n=1 Tax=Moorella thermoacetica Y72 TaxID=1325331 RepID=A0A0S6UD70_NEOTH|nr:hypothetical protein MTY_1464 [Moorella thermoacetica Y72]